MCAAAATEAKPTLNDAQIDVIFAEIRALEARSTRAAITTADAVANLRGDIDAAIASDNLGYVKGVLKVFRGQLDALAESSLTAILAANLASRLNGDLGPAHN